MTFKIVTRAGEDSLQHAAGAYAFRTPGHIHGPLMDFVALVIVGSMDPCKLRLLVFYLRLRTGATQFSASEAEEVQGN